MLAVFLLLHKIDDELARVLDIVDGQILPVSQIHHSFLVEAPLLASDQDCEQPAQHNKPEEATEEDCQQEEVLVNEEGLLVALHFHVHHDHYRHESQLAQNVQQIG